MSELSKRLPDDNGKLQPLVGEIVQGLLAQIPWRSNLALLDKLEDLNAGAAVLAATINKNFEEAGR